MGKPVVQNEYFLLNLLAMRTFPHLSQVSMYLLKETEVLKLLIFLQLGISFPANSLVWSKKIMAGAPSHN